MKNTIFTIALLVVATSGSVKSGDITINGLSISGSSQGEPWSVGGFYNNGTFVFDPWFAINGEAFGFYGGYEANPVGGGWQDEIKIEQSVAYSTGYTTGWMDLTNSKAGGGWDTVSVQMNAGDNHYWPVAVEVRLMQKKVSVWTQVATTAVSVVYVE